MIPDSTIEFNEEFLSKIRLLEEYDKTIPTIDKKFSYGTCGFRYNENELDKVNIF